MLGPVDSLMSEKLNHEHDPAPQKHLSWVPNQPNFWLLWLETWLVSDNNSTPPSNTTVGGVSPGLLLHQRFHEIAPSMIGAATWGALGAEA